MDKKWKGEKGGETKIPLKGSVLKANHRAYRRQSGLMGFSRQGNSAYIGLSHFQGSPPWPGLRPVGWPTNGQARGNTGSTLNSRLFRPSQHNLVQARVVRTLDSELLVGS